MTPSPAPDRRAIGVLGAYVEGWQRVLKAPAVWASLLVVAVVSIAAPHNVVAARLKAYSIPPGAIAAVGVEARRAVEDVPELLPGLIDPATVFVVAQQSGNLSVTAAAGMAGHVVFGIFLFGGVLDRLARARPVGSAAFFAACGVYLWRFLRLAVPTVFAVWVIEVLLRPYAVLGAVALAMLLVVTDFARVRAVVEDRRSMLGALLASGRFIRRNLFAVLLLSALNLAAMAVAIMLGGLRLTLETGLGLPFWLYQFQSLIALLLMIWTRLAFSATELVLFQTRLAHADYTAAPLPVWPDSPAAEAIENLTRVGQKAEDKRQKQSDPI